MGYKSQAVHRGSAYCTQCECKRNSFAGFSAAMAHARRCKELPCVLYCGTHSSPRKVWSVSDGWCNG
jgi:hypothetical protein